MISRLRRVLRHLRTNSFNRAHPYYGRSHHLERPLYDFISL